MFNQSQNLRPIPAAAASNGANGAMATSSVAQEVIDARQETQIWTTFALNPYLRTNDILISVCEGQVILSGTVADGVSKDLAKQIALGIQGINDVDNRIEVHANYKPPARSAEREFSEMVEDAAITSKVRSKILWSSYVERLNVTVDTKRGCVTLSGSAESAEANPEIVLAVIGRFEAAVTERRHMANRVDRPGEIINHEHRHIETPEQPDTPEGEIEKRSHAKVWQHI